MLDSSDTPLLDVDDLVTGYGRKQILNGVSLRVSPGEVVAVIGHNGAGKSTLLKAIFGLLPIWKGTVTLVGEPLGSAHSPRTMIRAGVRYVPQGNRVFSDLSVRENLELGGLALSDQRGSAQRVQRALELFPPLKTHLKQRAGTLSGGQKQMLALANGLASSPRLLLLDEPSLGLAPTLVTEMLEQIGEIAAEHNVAMLIVEQKVREILRIANRVYVLRNGAVSFSGMAAALHDESRLRDVYL